jgi:hypothetical protein
LIYFNYSKGKKERYKKMKFLITTVSKSRHYYGIVEFKTIEELIEFKNTIWNTREEEIMIENNEYYHTNDDISYIKSFEDDKIPGVKGLKDINDMYKIPDVITFIDDYLIW